EPLRLTRSNCDKGRAGTKAAEAPAYAEEQRTPDEARIDHARARKKERRSEQRRRAPARQEEADHRNTDGPGHHERERRIPAAGEIEESEHFRRIRHLRYEQTDSEHEARDERE